jgi:hypothetical protein
MISGNISLHDKHLEFTNILKLSTRFTISWGYKTNTLKDIYLNSRNPDELSGIKSRDNIDCVVISASGSNSNAGEIIYNCGFICSVYLADSRKIVKFKSGTKGGVVKEVMAKLGIVESYIEFSQKDNALNSEITWTQWTSDIRFLNQLAFDLQCIFSIGVTPKGTIAGLFVSKTQLKSTNVENFVKSCLGSIVGKNKLFEYSIGSQKANVISYSWKNNAGENGSGDGASFELINGKPQIIRYFAEAGTVKAYKLNDAKVAEFERTYKGGQLEAVGLIMNASQYDSRVGDRQAKDFFDVVDQSTAPQGAGFTLNIECLGDPTVMPPSMIKLGQGFPDFWHYNNMPVQDFFIKKATHKLDSTGYKMSIEAADIVTTYGSYIQ